MNKKCEDHKARVIREIENEYEGTPEMKAATIAAVKENNNENYWRFTPPAYQVEDDYYEILKGSADEDLKVTVLGE